MSKNVGFYDPKKKNLFLLLTVADIFFLMLNNHFGDNLMEESFNTHLGKKLRMRRLSLGLTQTKVANAINVTFQQIQKYEKGTNGVSSSRLVQLSNSRGRCGLGYNSDLLLFFVLVGKCNCITSKSFPEHSSI